METQLQKLKREVAEQAELRERQERRKRVALADLATSKPGSPNHAHAVAERNEAESLIAQLSTLEAENAAKIEALELRDKILASPEISGDMERQISEAAELRKQMEKHLASFAKKYNVAMAELEKVGGGFNKILELDPRFDEAGLGRGSVTGWMRSQAGFFTGEASAYTTRNTPELPGTGFSHSSAIEQNIRERFEKRAEGEVRRRMLSGEEV